MSCPQVTVMEMKAEALHLGRGAESGVRGPPGKCLCACAHASQGSSRPRAQLTAAESLPRARPPPDDPGGGHDSPHFVGEDTEVSSDPPRGWGEPGAVPRPYYPAGGGGRAGEGGVRTTSLWRKRRDVTSEIRAEPVAPSLGDSLSWTYCSAGGWPPCREDPRAACGGARGTRARASRQQPRE